MWFIRCNLVILLCSFAAGQNATNLDLNVKGSRLPMWGSDSGAANAYVLTTTGVLAPTLRTGSAFMFAAAHSNTTASTLDVDGTGAIAIKKMSSGSLVALASGDIYATQIHIYWYDGTYYQCVTCAGSGTLSLPLTTLGDILYMNSTPALARLAGQITSTKKYLSQTGTGSISAAPAWAQVDFSDLSSTLGCSQLPTFTGDVTNSLCAMTAIALHLSPTPTLCGSGNFARGIDANGNATGCTAAPGAGGSGTAGPLVDVAACSNVDASGSNIASLGCSSGAISGDVFVMFCQFFTNDGGTATLAASSSPSETWTTDKTFFSTGIATPSRSSVFRATVNSTATYTFTCSPSTSKPFAFMSVFKVTGVSAVDASTTGTGATSVITTGLITTATDNDLIFLHAATNGSDPNCDAPTQTPMSWNLIQRGDIGSYLGVKKVAAAGSYTLAAKGCNSSWGAIGIAYK